MIHMHTQTSPHSRRWVLWFCCGSVLLYYTGFFSITYFFFSVVPCMACPPRAGSLSLSLSLPLSLSAPPPPGCCRAVIWMCAGQLILLHTGIGVKLLGLLSVCKHISNTLATH